ncbi:DUF2268 domain-containing protein [Hymenobacter latericus]|uniref:DUF2268 domain-containing protein n=1 Tax=Hymenobacter sp. YIM 151858-1 TaxID=2987688 RepID=UPI002226CFAF|nr:DUF2268 domain-containing protein [Hymenobacter sp. YIM 151858-1]UYZ57660.1 DUF2268 domain-containing protein [Hymenobacter sp. YIM 151858-1]
MFPAFRSATATLLSAALLTGACHRAPLAPPAAGATAAATAVPPAATYQVINLMPAFEEFWQKARTQDEATQVKLFQQLLADRYPEVYNNSVLGGPADKTFADVLPMRYAKVQSMVLPKMDLVLRLSKQIGQDLPRYEASFRKTFPDLDYRGRLYFMYSLGGFDGGTRTIGGQQALLFGLDMIAYVYGHEADPAPFFHHEFFHVYHSQFFERNESVASALWREGLATYVAHALNPSANGVNLFGLPLNTPARTQADLPRYARELRAALDSEKREDYARYFLGGMDAQAATPARSGYYLGYLVAEKLAKRHSLPELAHANLAQLRPEIEQALLELETTPAPKP